MTDQNERWPAVGEAVTARMETLGMSQAELVRASGVSAFTVRKVMKGEPGNYRPDRLHKICMALSWRPDAIALILDGSTPDESWVRTLTQQIQEAREEAVGIAISAGAGKAFTTAGRSGATLEDLEAVDPEAAAKVRADIEFYLRRAREGQHH